MLGLQLGNYISCPQEALRRCGDWSDPGIIAPRADEVLRGMVREHLVEPLLEAAEDAPAYDENEDAAVMAAAAEGGGGGAGGRASWWWGRRHRQHHPHHHPVRADRVVGAVAIGVGLAAIAVGVAYAIGPSRRARVKEVLRAGVARAAAAAAVRSSR
jgi:hypothetical protein